VDTASRSSPIAGGLLARADLLVRAASALAVELAIALVVIVALELESRGGSLQR
jgi:hypothetical protein